jgi:hypothetical protein
MGEWGGGVGVLEENFTIGVEQGSSGFLREAVSR